MSLHPQEIGVWYTMRLKCVVSSMFFETKITAEVYRDIIQQCTALLHKDEQDAVFQQGNAQLYMAKDTRPFLTEFFGVRIC